MQTRAFNSKHIKLLQNVVLLLITNNEHSKLIQVLNSQMIESKEVQKYATNRLKNMANRTNGRPITTVTPQNGRMTGSDETGNSW